MNKNKNIVAAGLIVGGISTIFSSQSKAESSCVLPTVTPTPTVINITDNKEDTKVIKTENGFKTLTRVTAEPTKNLKNTVTKQLQNKATKQPQKINTKKLYTSVPFTAKFQRWIDSKCNDYGISTNVVMGVIWKESNFTIRAMGDNGEAYGLMQIQKKWHSGRMSKVGATNLLNCYDNVHVGINFLAELYKANGGNWHKTLMAYNGGQAYADRRVKSGLYSSEYSRKVMDKAYKYKAERSE